MAWFKRNYGLVIAGVISLALLGFAGYYLLTMRAQASEASAKLDEDIGKLKTLYGRNPFPNKENIEAAKGDEKKVHEFNQDLKRFFRPPFYPTNMTQRNFGILLATVLSELTQLAKTNEVTVPQDYKFSFASQIQNVDIPAGSIEPLTLQLMEVDAICRILLNSKINALDAVRRPSVTAGEGFGSTDFVSGKSVTNEWTITTPYEVQFRGFSPNLAMVLDGLHKASNFVYVQNVAVARAEANPLLAGDSPVMPMMNPTAPMQDSRYGSRYRGGPDRGPMRPSFMPPPQVVAPTRSASTNIFEEQQLKISISLETVRLNPKPGVVPAAAAPAEAAPAEAAPAADAPPVAENRPIQ